MIDKEKILAAGANCIEVAQYIGIDVVRRGANTFILCPGHAKRCGREDNKIGNCVIYDDGYICYACDPNRKHDMFEMVMEHNHCSFGEAIKIIADLYGGEELYRTNSKTVTEKLPLTADDLRLIGLRQNGKLFAPINGSYRHFEPFEGQKIEKINGEYLAEKIASPFSLINLKKENPDLFNELIYRKSLEALKKYKQALTDLDGRTAPKGALVYDLFEVDGYLDDSVFVGIANALKKKIWRCEELVKTFKKKQGG